MTMSPSTSRVDTGTVRTILTDDDPRLRTASAPVALDDVSLDGDIADLAATLGDFRSRFGFGRAISAPQVGIMKRLIVLDLGAGPVALINPTITARSAEMQMVWDDCLSVPDSLVRVERHRTVSVRYENRAGVAIIWEALTPDMAELLQHECDHLDGVLVTDRVENPDLIRPIGERSALVPEVAGPAPRIGVADIGRHRAEIDAVFTNSPSYDCEPLSDAVGARVLLKVETLNPIRCFKGRGASLLIADHAARGRPTPVVTASAGNWGQAIAYACRRHGIACTVFAATGANRLKLERMRSLGAEVVLHGADFDEAKEAGKRFASERSMRFVEDGQDVLCTVGHGSMAVELTEHLSTTGEHLDAVLVPIGNGAMIAGIGTWMRAASPATTLIGVTAEGAPAMRRAWLQPDGWSIDESSSSVDTIADGLAVRVPVADAVDDVNRVTDDVIDVGDADIVDAMNLLHATAGLVTEPAGAAAVAALLRQRERFANKHVGVIICGSNVAADAKGPPYDLTTLRRA